MLMSRCGAFGASKAVRFVIIVLVGYVDASLTHENAEASTVIPEDIAFCCDN